MHVSLDVEVSEVQRLKAKLLQAQEEIEYLKQHQNVETREALEMVCDGAKLV